MVLLQDSLLCKQFEQFFTGPVVRSANPEDKSAAAQGGEALPGPLAFAEVLLEKPVQR